MEKNGNLREGYCGVMLQMLEVDGEVEHLRSGVGN